jgi:hypothetical protein
MITHYIDGNPTAEWVKESAEIEHDAENGTCIEYKDGRWIVGGVVAVDSIDSALDLLLEAA